MALLRGLAAILAGIRDLGTNGLIARTSATTVAARTITGTSMQIMVADGDGVSGNPTLTTSQDLDDTAEVEFAKVGAGVAPGYTGHFYEGASGQPTANVNADVLVIEDNTNGGASVLVPDGSTARVALGSASEAMGLQISWKYDALLAILGTRVTGAEIQIKSGDNSLAMLIASDGRVSIGANSSGGQLKIQQPDAAAAYSCLTLGQAAETVEFISFRGDSESGLSKNLVPEAAVTTATRAGFVKVNLIDDGSEGMDGDVFLPVYTLA